MSKNSLCNVRFSLKVFQLTNVYDATHGTTHHKKFVMSSKKFKFQISNQKYGISTVDRRRIFLTDLIRRAGAPDFSLDTLINNNLNTIPSLEVIGIEDETLNRLSI